MNIKLQTNKLIINNITISIINKQMSKEHMWKRAYTLNFKMQ